MTKFRTPLGWLVPGCPGYYTSDGVCTYDASIFQPRLPASMLQPNQILDPVITDVDASHWPPGFYQNLAPPFHPGSSPGLTPIVTPVATTIAPMQAPMTKILKNSLPSLQITMGPTGRRRILRKKLNGLSKCNCNGLGGISPVVMQSAPSDPVIQNVEAGLITGLLVGGLAGVGANAPIYEGPADTVGGEFLPPNPFGIPSSGDMGSIQPLPSQQPGFFQSVGQGIGQGIGIAQGFGQSFTTPPVTTWLAILAAIMIVPPLLKRK